MLGVQTNSKQEPTTAQGCAAHARLQPRLHEFYRLLDAPRVGIKAGVGPQRHGVAAERFVAVGSGAAGGAVQRGRLGRCRCRGIFWQLRGKTKAGSALAVSSIYRRLVYMFTQVADWYDGAAKIERGCIVRCLRVLWQLQIKASSDLEAQCTALKSKRTGIYTVKRQPSRRNAP